MHPQRVRMIDVAKAAGVSRTTASFVLNGRDAAIPLETKQRVLQAAHQMGYRRNASAFALATGRTNRIGIVLNDPASFAHYDLYWYNVVSGVTSAAYQHNYNLLLHSAHYTDWHALYGEALSKTADGMLLIGRFEGDELTTALIEAGVPAVCVSYHSDHPGCYSVDCDNEQGGYLALQHLLRLGHEQIAFFYPGDAISWGRERHQGAVRAMQDAGLPVENLRTFAWKETSGPMSEWLESALTFLQTARPRPTAFVCCEEARARNLVEALPGLGIRVPDDMAAISFNSTAQSAGASPPITSVGQPLVEIGAAAVEMLIQRIEGRDQQERCRRFPMWLDVRESCGSHLAVARAGFRPVGTTAANADISANEYVISGGDHSGSNGS